MANTKAGHNFSPSKSSTTMHASIVANQLSLFGMNLTQTPSVKLDRNNFLLWKNMIMPIIKGHNLEAFILGTKKCPPEFIGSQTITNDGERVEMLPNLEHIKWISTDQLLMGWLYSSMTPEIANGLLELKQAMDCSK
ncbi:Uncharacterized protein Adt_22200 [Abeliophyllum distichum]|uniref:Retrotransposon Copia-like N-terminal domain-containing protein n=1 Tax=Abeliophyllum distichum TaxID=126358 RepID=A0ABD1T1H8_9LAMI